MGKQRQRRSNPMTEKRWRAYERVVAAMQVENADVDMSITPNAHIIGAITKTPRQVDVLVDARWDSDFSRRIIVDAKFRNAKLDVNDVEAFEGMLRDCRAERGI